MKQYITDEANARLAFYSPLPSTQPPMVPAPPRPQLPEGVVDAPLVRLYNFLRMASLWMTSYFIETLPTEMMSLSYQLEILWYQVGSSLAVAIPHSYGF